MLHWAESPLRDEEKEGENGRLEGLVTLEGSTLNESV